MFGFGGIFNRNNKNTGTPAHPTSDPNVINISDYIGSLDEKGDVYTTPISTFGLSRIPGDKVIRINVLDKLLENTGKSHKLFRDAMIGKCDGDFPVTNPIKDNVYYDNKSRKYYKCITAYTGKIDTPDDKFEELSLLNNKGVKTISLSGGVKGSGNIDKDGMVNIVTTINYKDINGTPTFMPNEHGLTIKLNGAAQEKYDGKKAVEFNITPSSIGAQVAGNYSLADHNHDTMYVKKDFLAQSSILKYGKLNSKEEINNVNLPDGYYVAHDEMVSGYTDWWNLLSYGADTAGGGKVQLAAPFTHSATTSGGITDSHLFVRVGDKTEWKSDWRKIYTSADFALSDLIKNNGGRVTSGVLHIDSDNGALRFNSANNKAQFLEFIKAGRRKMYIGNGSANNPNKMEITGSDNAYLDVNGFKSVNFLNVVSLHLGRVLTAGHIGNGTISLAPNENKAKTLNLHDFGTGQDCYFNLDLGSKAIVRNSKDPVEDADLATKRYVDNKLGGASGFAPLVHTHTWSDITEKPTTFTPSEHNHNSLYNTKTEITNLLKGYSSVNHNHDDKYQLKGNYALSNHKHTGADITSLTGYTKATSISAITATDSLLVALGKLEKSLDNKQVAGEYAAKSHNHNDLYNTKSEITGLLANKLGKTETAASASKLATGRTISISGAVTGSVVFDGSTNATINTTLAGFDASKITSGIISVDRLPKTALSEFIPVANKEARLKLTKEQAQNGDTVKEADTGKMFLIIDDTKLNVDAGYQEYTTVVDWASITGKPSTFTPTAHNHTWAQISDRPTAMASPHGLTISLNGKAQTVYTGAAAVAFNITAASIGAQVAGNYANANHNHNDLYAAISHTHSEYQAKGDYALSNHNHDTVYAAKSHNHNDLYNTKTEITDLLKGYSLSTHDHNGVYAPVAHKHDEYQPKGNYQPAGSYALSSHNHSGVYAPVSHSHSEYQPKGSYAAADHNHNSVYAAISHKHSEYQPVGSYAAASHTHNYAASASAGGDATRALSVKDYAGDVNIKIGYSGTSLNASTCKFLAGYDRIADGTVRIKDISAVEARSFIGAAAEVHTHSGYAPVNHTHSGYQPAGSYAAANHTHNIVKDIGNATDTTFAYSKAGLNWDEFTWLAGWNGYELRAINKGLFVSSSGGTINGSLTVTGQLLSNADVVAYSDARFKANLRLISNPTSILDKINGYYYDMLGVENSHQVGVIAQEVQKVLPEAVFEDDNGHLGVRYTNLIPVLIEAVKEERSKRLELEERLAKIERMLDIK